MTRRYPNRTPTKTLPIHFGPNILGEGGPGERAESPLPRLPAKGGERAENPFPRLPAKGGERAERPFPRLPTKGEKPDPNAQA